MNCDFCGRDKFVKENEMFGKICYFCLKRKVSLLNMYLDEWFERELRERIQSEVVSFTRTKNKFDFDEFLDYYPFDKDVVIESALKAIRDGGLPEFVRGELTKELKKVGVLE